MIESNPMPGEQRPLRHAPAANTVDTELDELDAVRALGRKQQHNFSFATLRRWHELEHAIECKLDDMGRLSQTCDTGWEAALARVHELVRAVRDLIEQHSQVPAQ
jgi:hypothetical protein